MLRIEPVYGSPPAVTRTGSCVTDRGMLESMPWDLAPHLPWSVFTSPADKWAAQPSFLIGEYLSYKSTCSLPTARTLRVATISVDPSTSGVAGTSGFTSDAATSVAATGDAPATTGLMITMGTGSGTATTTDATTTSTTADTTGDGGIDDPSEPNNTEESTIDLGDQFCNGEPSAVDGLLSSGTGVDGFIFHGFNNFVCTPGTPTIEFRWIADADVRICAFLRCHDDTPPTIDFGSDAADDTSPAGLNGCCATGEFSFAYVCDGIDDNADVYIRIDEAPRRTTCNRRPLEHDGRITVRGCKQPRDQTDDHEHGA
jgi:hypothetical protein